MSDYLLVLPFLLQKYWSQALRNTCSLHFARVRRSCTFWSPPVPPALAPAAGFAKLNFNWSNTIQPGPGEALTRSWNGFCSWAKRKNQIKWLHSCLNLSNLTSSYWNVLIRDGHAPYFAMCIDFHVRIYSRITAYIRKYLRISVYICIYSQIFAHYLHHSAFPTSPWPSQIETFETHCILLNFM